MSDSSHLGELQRYTVERPLELPASAKGLWRSLWGALIKASNAKKITTPPGEITRHVLLLDKPPPQVLEQLQELDLHRGAFCVVGGVKNQNRDPGLPHIERKDGAWFDFSITVRELGGRLELLAQDFEIRLVPGMGVPFLRFDLNLPDHRNQDRELRCHLHPGSDDILVPAPLMSPLELLTLFIDEVKPSAERKAARTPTGFEVSWLKRTLEGLERH